MLGLLLYVLNIVICDTILTPSCTVRCPGATESLVLLCISLYLYLYTHHRVTSSYDCRENKFSSSPSAVLNPSTLSPSCFLRRLETPLEANEQLARLTIKRASICFPQPAVDLSAFYATVGSMV